MSIQFQFFKSQHSWFDSILTSCHVNRMKLAGMTMNSTEGHRKLVHARTRSLGMN